MVGKPTEEEMLFELGAKDRIANHIKIRQKGISGRGTANIKALRWNDRVFLINV